MPCWLGPFGFTTQLRQWSPRSIESQITRFFIAYTGTVLCIKSDPESRMFRAPEAPLKSDAGRIRRNVRVTRGSTCFSFGFGSTGDGVAN